MKQTTARHAHSPITESSKPTGEVGRSDNYRKDFFVAAMNMSWQLAVVVLVPIIGGFELDKKLDTLPALTIIGFLVAMAGMAAVVWRQLQLFSPPVPHSHNGKGSHA